MKTASLIANQKKRLLGHWRSDAKKTVSELALRKDISKKQLRFFRKLFGRLEVDYRPSTLTSGFAGEIKKSCTYKILGADADSIVIGWYRKTPAVLSGPQIQQIHFEGDFYWVSLGKGSREFFKRINPNTPLLKRVDLADSLKRLRAEGARPNKGRKSLKKVAKPIDLGKLIGKGNGGLRKMGYKKSDDFIRYIRGR